MTSNGNSFTRPVEGRRSTEAAWVRRLAPIVEER
jgi:hypothetical protein